MKHFVRTWLAGAGFAGVIVIGIAAQAPSPNPDARMVPRGGAGAPASVDGPSDGGPDGAVGAEPGWPAEGRVADRREARARRREAREQRRAERWNRPDHDGVHLRVLRDYRLPEGETANEPIIVIGGSATIDGRATDDVVAVGGSIRVGRTGVVLGDAVSVGGDTVVEPGGRVAGDVSRARAGWPDVAVGWPGLSRGWWAAAALAVSVVRLAALLAAVLLLAWLAPAFVRRVGLRAGMAPWSSVATGVAAEVLFVPALVCVAIAMLVSIVGIPLLGALPLLVAAAAGVAVAGFAGVAARLGARLRGREVATSASTAGDVAAGTLLLVAVVLGARLAALGPEWLWPLRAVLRSVAVLTELAMWTVGLGAVIQTLLDRWRPAPPIPVIETTVATS